MMLGLAAGWAAFGGWWRAAPPPLAVVTQTRFVEATTAGEPLVAGRPLAGRPLAILGGAVALRLSSGVEIVLEGPAELELESDMKAVLRSGAAVVKMPQGRDGFRVETATAEVLDLGTEFAVRAGPGRLTDVQVYDGAVIATLKERVDAGGFPRRLEAGQAARFSADESREIVELPYAEERFVRRLPKDRGIEHFVPGPPGNAASALDVLRQFGRPRHGAIVVRRVSGPVTIDGRLDEWATAPGFKSWLGNDEAAAEWVDGRMMYDAERLYIAALVGDPMPLASRIDPAVDAEDGWRGGSVQVRLSTDRSLGWPIDASAVNYYRMRNLEPQAADREAAENPRLAHLTMWFHAPSQTPCLSIVQGMLTRGLQVNPSGFKGAFAPAPDERGYVLEYAIPWRLLAAAEDPPQPGDMLGAAWQVHFSDEGGRLWRTQILDVRNPAEPPRIFTWERAATWGRAEYR
jgi:hypothetical protein